MIVTMIKKRW